jgi:hypothetical protein
MFASSFFVSIEPAPADLLFLVVLACFLGSGLTISAVFVPLVLLLLLYNLGGFFSFLQVTDDHKAMMFVITSFYMASRPYSLPLFARPPPHASSRITVIAAVITSTLGILGYFN